MGERHTGMWDGKLAIWRRWLVDAVVDAAAMGVQQARAVGS